MCKFFPRSTSQTGHGPEISPIVAEAISAWMNGEELQPEDVMIVSHLIEINLQSLPLVNLAGLRGVRLHLAGGRSRYVG